MFDKKYEDRLRAWADFRSQLENSGTPVEDVINFYNRAPLVSISTDPYDETTWLDPWTLLYENTYCDFSIILAIAYTLQLTTRFSSSKFEIHICTDKEKSEVKYLLIFDNIVVGYRRDKPIKQCDLPKSLLIEKIYQLPELQ
jgi:hypothetical protein